MRKGPFKNFNETINYSSSNEDTYSELEALEINGDDVVLAITGGGARVLDLLIAEPKKIIAVDINPHQNHLLELKMAAIKSLGYEKYAEFLGLRDCKERISLYRQIRSHLSPEARCFWDSQSKMLGKGVIYQGRWERYFKTLSCLVKMGRRDKVKKLFSFTGIEEQREFCQKEWNTKAWKLFIKLVCCRFFWKYFFKDPAFYHYVPKNFPVGEYIFESMSESLYHFLAKENHFFSLLVLNKYINEKSLPIYLEEKSYSLIKKNLARVEIVTDSLQRYLDKCPERSISKFSLSDISSFTSDEEYISLLKSCRRVSTSGGCFCIRHFLVQKDFPESLRKKIRIFSHLENELAKTDLSFGYTFTIGEFL